MKFLGIDREGENSLQKYFFNGMQIWTEDSKSFLKFENSETEEYFGCVLNENYIRNHLVSQLKKYDQSRIEFLKINEMSIQENNQDEGVVFTTDFGESHI